MLDMRAVGKRQQGQETGSGGRVRVTGTGEGSLKSWVLRAGVSEKMTFASSPAGSEGFSPGR